MAWNTREIENISREKLIEERDHGPGEQKYGLYTTARKHLIEEVLPEIKAVLPEHTDHGQTHVENVLDNAKKLLGADIEELKGTELYSLILAILFHDVGNVFSRNDHQRNVTKVYDFVRPANLSDKNEKYIVLRAASAHCGTASDGSKDTLKEVDHRTAMDGEPVRLQEISAILRFADELAEGRQRTSRFMEINHRYSRSSKIYHNYAKITTVDIDRPGERIALTYNIEFSTNGKRELGIKKQRDIFKLLEYTYKRIVKLNQERKYTKHYSNLLSPFKKTTIVFNFWGNGDLLDLGLGEVALTDLVVPEEETKEFVKYAPSHDPALVMEKIQASIRGV